jgi:signal transduction histidine kinase
MSPAAQQTQPRELPNRGRELQGLWAVLESDAHAFAITAGVALDWHLSSPATGWPELPHTTAGAVSEIFQEMLCNVARHAGASRVLVSMALDEGLLRLTVRDNGCGVLAGAFESPQVHGVLGMHARAHQFGGRIAFASRPGRGTSFTLLLPLHHG